MKRCNGVVLVIYFGSQISVISTELELRISSILCSDLTHLVISPNALGGFGVPKFTTLQHE